MTIASRPNLIWQHASVTRQLRAAQSGHQAVVLWFTGLSGAGKSTLAQAVEAYLFQQGMRTYVLDGDNVRQGLCADLGFSAADRTENIRRIGETAKLMLDAGVITLAAFISPFAKDRALVRALMPDDFVEIYCHCSLETCAARDVKGLYQKARAGTVSDFTGISSPYEIPEQPELILNTEQYPVDACVAQVMNYLWQRGIARTAADGAVRN